MKRLPQNVLWVVGSFLLIGFVFAWGSGCNNISPTPTEQANSTESPTEKIKLVYWEKWDHFEAEAMKRLVEDFNASQDRIEVEYVRLVDIRTKTLLAVAGGRPPDIAGLFPEVLPLYAEKEAILPLDGLMERDNINASRYLPVIFSLCQHEGHTWGLPTTPTSLALYYNKRLFREAGLDPQKPPRTLEELQSMARRITRYNEDGRIERLGFSPELPRWFRLWWIHWFGGRLWDGEGRMTLDSPEAIAMLEWVQSFPITFGTESLQRFHATEGPFNSAQNLFIAGRVGMQLQGVWMANFIERNNPNLEWDVAPFPTANSGGHPVTIVNCDVLVIPRGSRHPEEAWEFIRFVQMQKNMERLCRDQWKFSPLVQVSESFYANHPHPRIQMFRTLSESPGAVPAPRPVIIEEVREEVYHALDSVWLLQATPHEAAQRAQVRLQGDLEQQLTQWKRVEKMRRLSWLELMPAREALEQQSASTLPGEGKLP
ncbi:MAG: ABC transporter substrate-binding protein [Candidatus Sumerlaeia bacterium]|nr:ABC transporter substrate-binding protein [Candidatus Sumerlaeia bacterium]